MIFEYVMASICIITILYIHISNSNEQLSGKVSAVAGVCKSLRYGSTTPFVFIYDG